MKPGILLAFLTTWLFVDVLYAEDEDDQLGSSDKYQFKVQISGRTIKITCATKESTTLKKKENNELKEIEGIGKDGEDYILSNFSATNNGLYECKEKYLYLNAYVCETCTDVSITTVAVILIADCLVTIAVSFIVYFACRRKPGRAREGGFANGGHKRGNKDLPPPVPDPDYQPIQKGRRDVYDALNRNY